MECSKTGFLWWFLLLSKGKKSGDWNRCMTDHKGCMKVLRRICEQRKSSNAQTSRKPYRGMLNTPQCKLNGNNMKQWERCGFKLMFSMFFLQPGWRFVHSGSGKGEKIKIKTGFWLLDGSGLLWPPWKVTFTYLGAYSGAAVLYFYRSPIMLRHQREHQELCGVYLWVSWALEWGCGFIWGDCL